MTETTNTERVRELYEPIPFHERYDVCVERATDEEAVVRIPYDETFLGNPEIEALHGGVVSAAVDLTGAAIFVGIEGDYTPTIDLRTDYLSHVPPAEMVCRAEKRRRGGSVGVADVTVSAAGEVRARGRGVYKLSY